MANSRVYGSFFGVIVFYCIFGIFDGAISIILGDYIVNGKSVVLGPLAGLNFIFGVFAGMMVAFVVGAILAIASPFLEHDLHYILFAIGLGAAAGWILPGQFVGLSLLAAFSSTICAGLSLSFRPRYNF